MKLSEFTSTFDASPDQMREALYLGTVDPVVYEAHSLYHQLIMYARFDHPIGLHNDDALQLVYAYMLVHRAMMQLAPYIGPYPMPVKYKFRPEMNRRIYVRRGLARDMYR